MPSITAETTSWEGERAELQTVLQSPLFARSPALSHLLSYLCEKTFAGETDQIKEYSVAVDVFDRQDSFDQDSDSIVRVHANRLRKRLTEYYGGPGASHEVQIVIPVGQYVPSFQRKLVSEEGVNGATPKEPPVSRSLTKPEDWTSRNAWFMAVAVVVVAGLLVAAYFMQRKPKAEPQSAAYPPPTLQPAQPVGLPVGEEVHILAGSNRKYVDHAGKVWDPDTDFSGGSAAMSTVQHIWRTQDPIIYRNSRQGDFSYNVPLKPGTYELHLHFAETFYGPENEGGGGEGSRTMTVSANGQPLLRDLDVLADAGGDRTAEVKVFHDVSPASDGQLHLSFSSGKSGSAMLSAIEILPGVHGQIRPVRIVARDVPYYSNDSRWWSPDLYFKGGQISSSQEPAENTDDPDFYETERWGHFSYAIPVPPGQYTVTMHFIEHHAADSFDRMTPPASHGRSAPQGRVFNVFCNGKTVIDNLDIVKQVGENRPLVRKISGLEPNAQGKLLLEFVPETRYATVTAIEVVAE
ncbi:MAG TPA: malectin domain-containing carbohydrate-binding protein [Candidatus Sulfotelmatobacter sp.]|nr:malectin domain-containing carbohydrate-binding protein [Candidatus Sulfotelmatobacter sp.]